MERRTLSEIYDQLATEKAEMAQLDSWYTDKTNPASVQDDHQTLLQDLTSSSKVAIWRLLLWVVAVGIWIHEGLWFQFKSEVEADLDKHIAHTEKWYKEESLKWQYGDELVWNDARRQYEYPVYDESKQIVVQAAVTEGSGQIAIKAARTYNGALGALTALQKTAFVAFWNKSKDAGVILNVISEPADLLKLEYVILYDPLLMNADGELLSDSSKPVEIAINSYISSLDFNGRLRLESLDNVIRSATGVIDFKRNLAQSKYGLNGYTDIDISEIAYAGYYSIDPAFLLENTLTYTANV